MSRLYHVTVNVESINPEHLSEVADAAEDKSCISEPFDTLKKGIYGAGMVSLTGGQSEQEYVTAVSRAIWIANRGYCEISIGMSCLEDAPLYCLGREHYAESKDYVEESIESLDCDRHA